MKVIAVIQSKISPTADPVEMVWAKDTDAIGAAACVATMLSNNQTEDPFTRLLSIRIDV